MPEIPGMNLRLPVPVPLGPGALRTFPDTGAGKQAREDFRNDTQGQVASNLCVCVCWGGLSVRGTLGALLRTLLPCGCP